MKKIIFFLVLIIFISVMGCSGEKDISKLPDPKENRSLMESLPEGPLSLSEGSDPEANTHNDEGILHYKDGHFDIALKHFRDAEKIKPEIGEIHFNMALALDKLGGHGDAAEHFKIAQDNANGNSLILESKILLAHIQ